MTSSPLANRSADAIRPGLMVVHGNRLEDLRDLLVEWLAHAPLAPLEDEVMLVQSNGIAQWLKLALARPRTDHGMGISAAVDMQLPGRFLWQAYRAVLGSEAVPAESPFDKSRLTWRLMRLLPAQLDHADFAPLRHYLGANRDATDQPDPIKLFQLAQQIADLFDQYQVYRADWLEDWEHGRDVLRDELRGHPAPLLAEQRWQPRLWRALLDDVGPTQRDSHRAAVHRAFMQRAAGLTARPAALPRRIVVFGISSLPQQTLEALTALGRVAQVFLLVANPCRHYWGDIIEDRELLRAERHRHDAKPGMPATPRFEDLHAQANPLLAAWGKQGRDYIRLLDAFDVPDAYRDQFVALSGGIDLFTDLGTGSLLHQVQQAILDLDPLPADPAQRRALPPGDDSLRFHIAHNPQREVEILHDNLLAMFEAAQRAGRPLSPRDVMVMVPDIQTYAPHIQAVFGRIPPDDPRYLPCSIADRHGRGSAPLLVALEQLLRLPESRFAASDILDLLDTPALRRRFRLDDDDLPVLRRWIEDAGIRWGLDGAQKETFGLPAEEQNTWRFGLRRMLLGYAVGDGESLDGIAPYAEIGGLDAALLGPLALLLDRLDHYRLQLDQPATPAAWSERLRNLLADFFDAGRDDADTVLLQRLHDALEAWEPACAEAGRGPARGAARGAKAASAHAAKSDPAPLLLPLAVVREHWLSAVDESRLSQRFLGGAVSFGTLLPMRAIPFRVVCLLGMNDSDYPRRTQAPDFDLMTSSGRQRPGDRSRREDDRYLFLEALLSARDTLYVSWVGRSARDNSELPPSVLVGQLRDYLAAGWKNGGPSGLSGHGANHAPNDLSDPLPLLTTRYPLQAFSQHYFENGSPLFTYAHEWQQARQRGPATEAQPLPPWHPEAALGIATLQGFLRAPAKTFYAKRLGVRFDAVAADAEDDEPFALDALAVHLAADALLRPALASGVETVVPAARRLREQGDLPPGPTGELLMRSLACLANGVGTHWHKLAEHWPTITGIREVRHAASALLVEDWIGDLRVGDDGGHLRLLATVGKLLDNHAPRTDKLTDAWIVHLLANANALQLTTKVVGRDTVLTLAPLPPAAAAGHLDTLFAAMATGMCAPLPLARKSACAWLQAERDGKDCEAAARHCYDSSQYSHGEVENDACLAREWPTFGELHAAGFEDWLHLYRPLFAALRSEGAIA